MKNLIILTFILAGLNAFAENSKKPRGLYRSLTNICSDGSVSNPYGKENVTLISFSFEKTMDFLSDSLVKISTVRTDGVTLNDGDIPLIGSKTIEYSLNNNELIYGNIIEWEYPNSDPKYRDGMQSYYNNSQKPKKISVNASQLILSYPGDDRGLCASPEYIINIYEKVN